MNLSSQFSDVRIVITILGLLSWPLWWWWIARRQRRFGRGPLSRHLRALAGSALAVFQITVIATPLPDGSMEIMAISAAMVAVLSAVVLTLFWLAVRQPRPKSPKSSTPEKQAIDEDAA
ncbi:MAG: hypothetical protein LBI68_10950 [Azoarcus sp.]|jgi:hypothetical protein|nr:hypothetical protein [Azoarcus sp.]